MLMIYCFLWSATYNNVLTIKSMLRCYELVSGLKVNFCKSSFGALGLERNTCEDFASI